MRNPKGNGQPTWNVIGNAVEKTRCEAIDSTHVKFLWACHEANLSAKTIKTIWNKFTEVNEMCRRDYGKVNEIRVKLKDETGIVLKPYKDWGKG